MAQGSTAKSKHKKGGKGHSKVSRRNQKVLMRWIALVAALLVIIVLIARCAMGGGSTAKDSETVTAVDETRSRIEIGKKGALTVTSVESFDKDYYDESELQTQIDAEIAAYRDEHGDHVSDQGLTVTDGVATLVMQYDAAADYTSFNDQEMFYGTLEEAENAGYDLSGLSGQTNATDENETYGEGTARERAGNPVVVLTEPLDVMTATDILYLSDNLTLVNGDYAQVKGDVSASAPAILILATK